MNSKTVCKCDNVVKHKLGLTQVYCVKCGSILRLQRSDGHRSIAVIKPPECVRKLEHLEKDQFTVPLRKKHEEMARLLRDLELVLKHEWAEVLAKDVGREEAYKTVFGEQKWIPRKRER